MIDKPTPLDLSDFQEKATPGFSGTMIRDKYSNESLCAGFEKLAAHMMTGAILCELKLNSEMTPKGLVKKTLTVTFIETMETDR